MKKGEKKVSLEKEGKIIILKPILIKISTIVLIYGSEIWTSSESMGNEQAGLILILVWEQKEEFTRISYVACNY